MTAPLLPMLWQQVRAEFLKQVRVPAMTATSMALPLVLYGFIGTANAGQVVSPHSSLTFGQYFLASMAVYACANVMVFSLGVAVANERGQKQDVLLRATPLPPAVYIAAKVVNAVVYSALALALLMVFAALVVRVVLPGDEALVLLVRVVLGSLPLAGFGYAVGYLAGPRSAVAVINLIYLPAAFASGIFYPTSALPSWIQQVAPYSPLYRLGQLGWDAVGAPTAESVTNDWIYLAVYGVLFFLLATWAYRRDESRKFV